MGNNTLGPDFITEVMLLCLLSPNVLQWSLSREAGCDARVKNVNVRKQNYEINSLLPAEQYLLYLDIEN